LCVSCVEVCVAHDTALQRECSRHVLHVFTNTCQRGSVGSFPTPVGGLGPQLAVPPTPVGGLGPQLAVPPTPVGGLGPHLAVPPTPVGGSGPQLAVYYTSWWPRPRWQFGSSQYGGGLSAVPLRLLPTGPLSPSMGSVIALVRWPWWPSFTATP
jgi:hypothetical protein